MLSLRFVVLILLAVASSGALVYLAVGKVKGKPTVSANASWLFGLLERMFDTEE
jgi:hypothetical protein